MKRTILSVVVCGNLFPNHSPKRLLVASRDPCKLQPNIRYPSLSHT